MTCQYGNGMCAERAVYRIEGDQEGRWGEDESYVVDVCAGHSLASCFEDAPRIWLGGNVSVNWDSISEVKW